MARQTALVSVAVETAIILILILLFTSQASQPTFPSQSSFPLQYTKTGGIAGLHESLMIEADGAVSFTSRLVSFTSRIGPIEFSELKDIIAENLDKISPKVIHARPNAADYFGYAISVSTGGKRTEIQWVDDWAAADTIPNELKIVARSIEKVLQVLTVQATFTNTNSNRPDLQGLSMTIFTDKPTYKPGEQVRIFVIIRNTGPSSVTYQSPTPCHPDIRITVSGGSRTQDVSFSDLPEVACIQVIQQRSLESNRFLTHTGTWNLVFDQDGPRVDASAGTYVISARFPLASFETALLEVSITATVVS